MARRTMRWDETSKRTRTATDLKPIKTDEAFWRVWHYDPAAMKASGCFVKKVGDEWQAFFIGR